MPRSDFFRVLGYTGLALLGELTMAAKTQSEVSVWKKMSTYLTREAMIELKDMPAPEDADGQRERDFCTAVVTLDQQPLSEGRLDDVEQRLKTLLSANGEDEIASASRYILGRIAQIYRAEPDVELAAEYYQMLVNDSDQGHWGRLARVKLGVLKLYVLPAESMQSRVDSVEALIEGTTDPVTRRDLHRLAGRGAMFFNLGPELALRHLLEADKFGGLSGTLGADQLVQIGELAWDTGQREISAHYYERLRKEYPRDQRVYLSDQRLAGKPVPQRREELNGR